jgi:hypothetical protein
MTRVSTTFRALLLVALTGVFAVTTVHAGQTIAYPSTDNAYFTVTAPDDWEFVPADEAGGFFNLNGPTGALISFRCVPGTGADVEDAIDETLGFVRETYNNVQVTDPQDTTLDGRPGFLMTGTGVDKATGGATKFLMAWAVMDNGNIAELWVAFDPNDKKGGSQAATIVGSFKGR